MRVWLFDLRNLIDSMYFHDGVASVFGYYEREVYTTDEIMNNRELVIAACAKSIALREFPDTVQDVIEQSKPDVYWVNDVETARERVRAILEECIENSIAELEEDV